MAAPNKKRKIVNAGCREMIAKVYHFLREEFEFTKLHNYEKADISHLSKITKRTAEATGVSEKTVSTILREERRPTTARTGFAQPLKNRRTRDHKSNVDNLPTELIRNTLHDFLNVHKESPTLAKLKVSFNQQFGFNGCPSTVRNILQQMGYECVKHDKGKILVEKHEIQMWRLQFLKKLTQYRLDERPVVYIGQTYVRLDGESSENAHCFILHACTKYGFIPNACYVHKIGITEDRNNMSHEKYVEWLSEKVFPYLPKKSIIVTEKASYFNSRSSRTPTSNSSKKDMQRWLTDNSVFFNEDLNKIELYELIRTNKDRPTSYTIEGLAEKEAEILVMPPHHPELNAMRDVMIQIKSSISQLSSKVGTEQVYACIEKVGTETLLQSCQRVEEIEKKYMQRFDSDCDYVNVQESDSDSSLYDE